MTLTLYQQQPGSLFLILPENTLPESMGFNPTSLVKWDKEPLSNIDDGEKDFAANLKSLLADDSEDEQILRLVGLNGHGSPSISDSPTIGGLNIPSFQAALQALHEKNMVGSVLLSCFVGGENLFKTTLPNGSVSCPTIILSSMETYSFMESENTLVGPLKALEKFLNPKNEPHIPYPKMITKADLRTMATHIPAFNRQGNIPQCLLPKSHASIPMTSEILYSSQNIFPISNVGPSMVISADKALFFRDPINLGKIVYVGTQDDPALLSQGGNAIHIIRELELPNHDLYTLARQTFLIDTTNNLSPVTKVFFIKSLKCQNELYENVMIKRNGKAAYLIYKTYEYSLVIFHLATPPADNAVSVASIRSSISYYEAANEFYRALFEAKPTEQTLSLLSGRRTFQEILDCFNQEFFQNDLSLNAQIQSVILHDQLHFNRQTLLEKTADFVNLLPNFRNIFSKQSVFRKQSTKGVTTRSGVDLWLENLKILHVKDEIPDKLCEAINFAFEMNNNLVVEKLLPIFNKLKTELENSNIQPMWYHCRWYNITRCLEELDFEKQLKTIMLMHNHRKVKRLETDGSIKEITPLGAWKQEFKPKLDQLAGTGEELMYVDKINEVRLWYKEVYGFDPAPSFKSLFAPQIFNAIAEGNFEELKAQIEKHPELINKRDADGRTPLALACVHNREEIALYLLGKGANPAILNSNLIPMIEEAVKMPEVVKQLAIHPDIVDFIERYDGLRGLEKAIRLACKETADFLVEISAGKEMDVSDAIHDCLLNDHFEDVLEQLLDYPKYDINKEVNGQTPLQIAIKRGNQIAIQLLINHGAKEQ